MTPDWLELCETLKKQATLPLSTPAKLVEHCDPYTPIIF